jgi:hypothetical protein
VHDAERANQSKVVAAGTASSLIANGSGGRAAQVACTNQIEEASIGVVAVEWDQLQLLYWKQERPIQW